MTDNSWTDKDVITLENDSGRLKATEAHEVSKYKKSIRSLPPWRFVEGSALLNPPIGFQAVEKPTTEIAHIDYSEAAAWFIGLGKLPDTEDGPGQLLWRSMFAKDHRWDTCDTEKLQEPAVLGKALETAWRQFQGLRKAKSIACPRLRSNNKADGQGPLKDDQETLRQFGRFFESRVEHALSSLPYQQGGRSKVRHIPPPDYDLLQKDSVKEGRDTGLRDSYNRTYRNLFSRLAVSNVSNDVPSAPTYFAQVTNEQSQESGRSYGTTIRKTPRVHIAIDSWTDEGGEENLDTEVIMPWDTDEIALVPQWVHAVVSGEGDESEDQGVKDATARWRALTKDALGAFERYASRVESNTCLCVDLGISSDHETWPSGNMKKARENYVSSILQREMSSLFENPPDASSSISSILTPVVGRKTIASSLSPNLVNTNGLYRSVQLSGPPRNAMAVQCTYDHAPQAEFQAAIDLERSRAEQRRGHAALMEESLPAPVYSAYPIEPPPAYRESAASSQSHDPTGADVDSDGEVVWYGA